MEWASASNARLYRRGGGSVVGMGEGQSSKGEQNFIGDIYTFATHPPSILKKKKGGLAIWLDHCRVQTMSRRYSGPL
jgi:hypothetical protein